MPIGIGVLTVLCFLQPTGVLAGVILGLGNAAIRSLESVRRESRWWLHLGAQAASFALLLVVVGWLANTGSGRWLDALTGAPLTMTAVLTGLLLVWWTGARAVGLFVAELKFDPESGIPNAGTIIGQLERTLILFLVLAGVPSGIGLLVAAKSILRFGEVKDPENREMAEYVLIGTLASFTFAIPVAYATTVLVRWAQ